MSKAETRRVTVFALLALFAVVILAALDRSQPFATIWVVAIVVDLTVIAVTLLKTRQ